MTDRPTVSDVLLEALLGLGVETLFANLGTDYPPIVEALARRERDGAPNPAIVLCPHENTAITAAHGYALATGRGQGVFVHVGVGTQNLGGALMSVMSGRVPMFIFAGRTPVTTRGERLGSRDNPIHFFQDVPDQAGIVRQYCKWEFNLELPEQISHGVHRGVRLMQSEPQGPVYMTAAREVLAMPAPEAGADPFDWGAVPTLGDLPVATAAAIAERLTEAERPLVITSYAGRDPEAVAALVELSETLGLPVLEPVPLVLNFPRDHAHHWGYLPGKAVAEADLILIVESDFPWLPKHAMPRPGTPVIQLDHDPVKGRVSQWDFPVTESYQVNPRLALQQISAAGRVLLKGREISSTRRRWLQAHRQAPPDGSGQALTPTSLSEALGRALPSEAVVFNEAITNAIPVLQGMRQSRPGSYYGVPGGSLGWGGGAAMGHKLARPGSEAVWVVGDGSFLFAVPSSLFMTAHRHGAPFLTVIYNNAGWDAVRLATERVYGSESHAARQGRTLHDYGDTEHLEDIAAACGCHTARATTVDEIETALALGRRAVGEGRCSVINALFPAP